MTLCQIKVSKGHEVKKNKFKIFGLGGTMHVFFWVRFSSKTQEVTQEYVFKAESGQNLKIEKCLNPRELCKSDYLGIKSGKSQLYSKIAT